MALLGLHCYADFALVAESGGYSLAVGHGLLKAVASLVARQLDPYTTATEPVLYSPGARTAEPICHDYRSPQTLGPMLCNKRRNRREKPAYQPESSCQSPQLEKGPHSNEDPAQPI